jgi:hypothetical protein
VAGKAGTGCDAPRWWEEGKLGLLERYCARDTEALAELVTRREIRLPGRMTTKRASVIGVLQVGTARWDAPRDAPRDGRKRVREQPDDTHSDDTADEDGHDDARADGAVHERPTDGTAQQRDANGEDGESGARNGKRAREESAECAHGARARAAIGETRAAESGAGAAHDEGDAETAAGRSQDGKEKEESTTLSSQRRAQQQKWDGASNQQGTSAKRKAAVPPEGGGGRPQRQRTQTQYDETRRRGPRRTTTHGAYMERGSGAGRRGTKRHAIVVGAATIERVVKGRYEWRDGGLVAARQ